jgi:glycerophosphoryl diester phosphodiesterase
VVTPLTPIWIEAHRGDSANAPENTLAAFRRAAKLGVRSTELDVHPSLHGTLVVLHDETLERTTDGAGPVGDKTVEELRRLDAGSWFRAQYAGERLPTLRQVLQLLAPTQTALNIEIKASARTRNVAKSVVGLLRQFGKEREYTVSSFDLEAVLAVRAIAPETTLALIGEGPQMLPPAIEHRLPWIHCHRTTLDERLVAAAHAADIRLNVWTVDDPAEMLRWQGMGVDKLCTNQPAVMLAALAEAGGGEPEREA